MKRQIGTGSRVSRSEYFFIQNASNTSGSGLTALTAATSNFTVGYTRERAAFSTVSLLSLASTTADYASGGFIEVSQISQAGLYRFDIPDAALATGVSKCIVTLMAPAGVPCVAEYQLDTDISMDPAYGIVCRGTISNSGTTQGTLGTVISGALTNCQAGDLLSPAGLPARSMNSFNSGNGYFAVQTAFPSTTTGLSFRVFGTAPADSTQPVYADVKKLNGTTLNGDGSGTPWGP